MGSVRKMSMVMYKRCLITFIALVTPILGMAEDLAYEIKTYGEEVVVTKITGPSAGTLSLTPSSDGKTLTISGIGSSFHSSRTTPYPEIIRSVRTLNRGQITDLVIELAKGSTVKASPSSDSLTITARIVGLQPVVDKTNNFPQQRIAILPPLPGGTGVTKLGTAFRLTSLIIDETSALLNGTKLRYDTGVYEQANACTDKDKRIKELENLVENLSQELLQSGSKK